MNILRVVTLLILPALTVGAQTVTITSPVKGSVNATSVTVAASTTNWHIADHLEVWDGLSGQKAVKLGNVFAGDVAAVYTLTVGAHNTTVNAVTPSGLVVGSGAVSYSVSANCVSSPSVQCDFDQMGIANPDTSCNNAPAEPLWVGNPCGAQGLGSTEPNSYSAEEVSGITSLNGKALLLSEDNAGYSNVLFSASTPTKTTELDSHWVMDMYVDLPNPEAHQAFEVDLQYVWGGYWTKFYTECAFNISNGTGYWGVYGGGNGWTFLNGHNNTPQLPCSRSQFSTPSTEPGVPAGWHHIVWTFIRNASGYAEYTSLAFDGATTSLGNYVPTTDTNGGSNQGDFAALVQLDGAQNAGTYPLVQAYIDELNITHTP
jgi:hypothetical protein